MEKQDENTLETSTFVTGVDDASTNSQDDDAFLAMSRGDLSRGFELFQNDMALYVGSMDTIERDTGIPFTYMHEMIIDNPCTRAFTWEADEGRDKVEVEHYGMKDLVTCTSDLDDAESVHEIPFPAPVEKEKRRSRFFRGLSRKRSFDFRRKN